MHAARGRVLRIVAWILASFCPFWMDVFKIWSNHYELDVIRTILFVYESEMFLDSLLCVYKFGSSIPVLWNVVQVVGFADGF